MPARRAKGSRPDPVLPPLHELEAEVMQELWTSGAGTAEEAAKLILFLVSPAASYLTGAQFAVDGGAFPTV